MDFFNKAKGHLLRLFIDKNLFWILNGYKFYVVISYYLKYK